MREGKCSGVTKEVILWGSIILCPLFSLAGLVFLRKCGVVYTDCMPGWHIRIEGQSVYCKETLNYVVLIA